MEINRGLFEALGMTVIDSLWQGAIVMSLAFLGLWLMKKSKASLRHNFLLVCILTLPILGIYSFSQRYERASPIVDITTIANETIDVIEPASFTSESFSTPLPIQSDAFEWVEMTPWIGVIWVIGLMFILIRSAGAYLYLSRLKSGATDIIDAQIIQQFNQLKDGFNLKGLVLLRESIKISSPMVYGYFKPVILFPLGLIQGLTMEEVEVILLHELAHLKRNDFLINIVINGLRAVYFYHPAFWWLQSQLDNEREFASDEIVMERKTDGLVLVRALTKAQEFSMLSPSIGFAGSSKHQLLKRVNRIMKKQQKPNWTGLLLPCAILLSVFLLSSQKEKGIMTSLDRSEELLEALGNDTLPEYFGIDISKPDVFEEINESKTDGSILFFDITETNKSIDTLSVAQATMELLEDPSPVEVTTGSDGKPIHIKRKGKMLDGEDFKTYEEAYLKLNKYSSKAAEKRMSGFLGGNKSVTTAMRNSSSEAKIKLRDSALGELVELDRQLGKEKSLMNEMVLDFTKAPKPTTEQAKALNAHVNKVGRLEQVINKMKSTMTDLQKERHREMQRELIDNDKQAEFKSLRVKMNIQDSMLRAEQAKLKVMIREATSNPDNFDTAALNDQIIKATQKQEDLIRMTNYSNEHSLVELLRGKESFEFFKEFDEYEKISNGDAILEVNGELRPDLKLSDLDPDSILSFSVFKGKSHEKRYPNGETKGYYGMVSITMIKGARIPPVGDDDYGIKRLNFGDSVAGQEKALMSLKDLKNTYSNPVVLFNGKFMPKDYVLKYTDAFIKEINVYKGDALKKFPKRKVKDHDAVIEVTTKKMPRRKN